MTGRGSSGSVTSGFIANTDFGWFSHFLHRVEPPDERGGRVLLDS
jgi:hypothetical protein